jgi:hypothetical protein
MRDALPAHATSKPSTAKINQSVAEAALIAGIDRATLHLFWNDCDSPKSYMGSCKLVARKALDVWLTNRKPAKQGKALRRVATRTRTFAQVRAWSGRRVQIVS